MPCHTKLPFSWGIGWSGTWCTPLQPLWGPYASWWVALPMWALPDLVLGQVWHHPVASTSMPKWNLLSHQPLTGTLLIHGHTCWARCAGRPLHSSPSLASPLRAPWTALSPSHLTWVLWCRLLGEGLVLAVFKVGCSLAPSVHGASGCVPGALEAAMASGITLGILALGRVSGFPSVRSRTSGSSPGAAGNASRPLPGVLACASPISVFQITLSPLTPGSRPISRLAQHWPAWLQPSHPCPEAGWMCTCYTKFISPNWSDSWVGNPPLKCDKEEVNTFVLGINILQEKKFKSLLLISLTPV